MDVVDRLTLCARMDSQDRYLFTYLIKRYIVLSQIRSYRATFSALVEFDNRGNGYISFKVFDHVFHCSTTKLFLFVKKFERKIARDTCPDKSECILLIIKF